MAEEIPIKPGLFKDGPDGQVLIGNACQSCGQVFFPQAKLCLDCGHEEMEEKALSQTGSLYSYTIAAMPTWHFQPPYAVGYVNLPEGVRVFAPLVMDENKPFEVGLDMELVIGHLWDQDDKAVIGYKFKVQ